MRCDSRSEYLSVRLRARYSWKVLQVPRQHIHVTSPSSCMLGGLAHLLDHLIRPKGQTTTRALNDDGRTQAAEDARLVVLGGVQAGNDGVVGIDKLSGTSGTYSMAVSRFGETQTASTRNAKDVTARGDHSLIQAEATTPGIVAVQSGIHGRVLPLVSSGITESRCGFVWANGGG